MAGKQYEAKIQIGGGLDPSLQKAISAAQSALGKLGGGVSKAANVAMDGLKAAAAAGTAAIGAVAAATVKFGADAVQAAASYEQAFANASTLMTGSAEDLAKVSDDILKVSSETGIAAEDIANSVYSAISAGIDQADAVEFAGKSAKLAAAGFTDVDTALTAVAKTLNAYGMDASHTDEIQKMLIQTQNLGITTVGELGASLAQVTPTAAAFGVSFDQVSASLAGMTAQGTPTAQATTQLNSLIAELGKDGTVASKNFRALTEHIQKGGLSFSEAMERGWDLADVLSLFDEEAQASGKSIVDMFSSIEAGKAALSIFNSDFAGNLEAMGTSADVVGEAYEKVTGTYEHQMEVLKNLWQNFKIEAGEAILPYITDLAQTTMPVIKGLMESVMPVVQRIISSVMPVLSKLGSTVIPKISKTIEKMMPFIEKVITRLTDGLEPVLNVVIRIVETLGVGLVPIINTLMPVIEGLVGFIAENLPTIITWLTDIISQIAGLVAPIAEALAPILGELFASLMPVLTQIVQDVMPALSGILTAIAPLLIEILAALQPIISLVLEYLPTVITIIGGILTALTPIVDFLAGTLANTVKNVFANVKTALNGLISFITGVFTGDWQKAWDGVKDIFSGAFGALSELLKTPMNAVITLINKAIAGINKLQIKIPDYVPNIGGNTFGINIPEIPLLARGGFTRGVSIAGEAGTEAVISFDPSARQENLSYWARAGKLLGANPTAVDTVAAGAGKGSQGNYITFSPNVTIQGNADYDTVMQALRDNEAEFMDLLKELMWRERNVAYG